jgi:hypothetical protein
MNGTERCDTSPTPSGSRESFESFATGRSDAAGVPTCGCFAADHRAIVGCSRVPSNALAGAARKNGGLSNDSPRVPWDTGCYICGVCCAETATAPQSLTARRFAPDVDSKFRGSATAREFRSTAFFTENSAFKSSGGHSRRASAASPCSAAVGTLSDARNCYSTSIEIQLSRSTPWRGIYALPTVCVAAACRCSRCAWVRSDGTAIDRPLCVSRE